MSGCGTIYDLSCTAATTATGSVCSAAATAVTSFSAATAVIAGWARRLPAPADSLKSSTSGDHSHAGVIDRGRTSSPGRVRSTRRRPSGRATAVAATDRPSRPLAIVSGGGMEGIDPAAGNSHETVPPRRRRAIWSSRGEESGLAGPASGTGSRGATANGCGRRGCGRCQRRQSGLRAPGTDLVSS